MVVATCQICSLLGNKTPKPAQPNVVRMRTPSGPVRSLLREGSLLCYSLSNSVEHWVMTIGNLVLIVYSRWQSPNPEGYFKCDIYSTLLHHSVRQATSGKDKWKMCHKTFIHFFFSLHLCTWVRVIVLWFFHLLYICLIKAFYMWR